MRCPDIAYVHAAMCGTHTVWCYQAAIKAGKYHGGVLRDGAICYVLYLHSVWRDAMCFTGTAYGAMGTDTASGAVVWGVPWYHAMRLRTRCTPAHTLCNERR